MTGIAPGGIILSWHSFRRSCVGMPSATLRVVFGQTGRLVKRTQGQTRRGASRKAFLRGA